MSYGKFCRSELLETVLNDLRYKIITREFKPGNQLVEERISENYNISRGSIRTIFSMLAQEGLIEELSNGRKKILEFSQKDVRTYYDLRIYIECTAARTFLNNYSDTVAEIGQIIGKINTTIPMGKLLGVKESIDIDMEIHRALVATSHSKILLNTWDNLSFAQGALIKLNTSDWYQNEYIDTLRESHMSVFSALIQGDLHACDMLATHITRAMEISLDALKKLEEHKLP